MEVKTCLTWLEEKSLQNYFGGKQFSLLYKASVHGFSNSALLQRCSTQGPTLTVMYNKCFVFGTYMEQSYQEEKRDFSTVFVLQNAKISECKIGPYEPIALLNADPVFGIPYSNFSVQLSDKKVILQKDINKKLGLLENSTISIEECEVFRCEDLLDQRKIEGATVLRDSLLSALRTYKPFEDLVPQSRILLLGPFGAGKSSFFNSVKSVFQGHVTQQALVGSEAAGISKKYRTYWIKDKNCGKFLPFVLCDSLGLSEKDGLCMDDIPNILKGHTADRYQFESIKPITSNHPNYIHSPNLKDRIHCVAFVFDANSIEGLSHEMVAKIKTIQRELIKHGTMHVVLLTHVDSMDLIIKGDLMDIYSCVPVKLKLQEVHKKLGFALSDILVVSNYVSEWELDPVKDVLILSALQQMLWTADDYLEDQPLKETC
ncbi:interferon-induced protein 44 isoform X1 [Dipodomys spectabilis]|uniref:interferon-induced protein 44 isoform X1 n=1 Tax=Dipodomys spectabilis TaxID=105255 RepID=UPI001C5351CE|nr:interferon-induced protein 44 isoform X1 [Dipodomys spectabilis]XP_042536374.1 interferon-induced protein 44 isoform X1 [Dipodomys spectabilis]